MKYIIGEIQRKLIDIEQRENIKILHCVESGSRAWGFPSPDSDYDVRFIYVRPKEFYLKLEKTRDVIEWQLDDIFDINGWDLQKMLRLLHNSNPAVFEWKNSPIIYKTTDEWIKVSAVIDAYFNVKSGIYHYLNMAKTNYREYLRGEAVRVKKYFYVLRPLLACEYIRENKKSPPMMFDELLCYLYGDVKNAVLKLLELKANTSELGEGKKILCINEYIEKKIEEFENYAETVKSSESGCWDNLNEIFLSTIL